MKHSEIYGFSDAYEPNEDVSQEAGYMLLEVVVATAIAAVVVSLLMSSLFGLSRAQKRIGEASEILSEQIFDDALLKQIFQNLVPSYHDAPTKFLGEEDRISGRTFLDGKSQVFSLALQDSDNATQNRLVLQLDEMIFDVLSLKDGKLEFKYVDHFGGERDEWDIDQVGMVDKKLSDWAPHVEMLPRHFQILKSEGNRREILYSFSLPIAQILPQRPADLDLYLGTL